VLSGGHLYDDLDLPALETCLQRLSREENMVVFLSLKDNDNPQQLSQTEPWYGVKYGLELVPAHQVRQWSCSHVDSLHLPRPNHFIPEEFDLIHSGATVPPSATPEPPERALATDEHELELWYKLDKSFKQPRAYIIVDFCTPLVQRDPAAAELLTRYFDHALAEQTYDASVAGLSWSIFTTAQGLSLRFSGFSHKIQTLLHKVLEALLALNLHEGLFALAKEKAIDVYRNVKLARPDEHCAIYLALLLIEGRWDWCVSPCVPACLRACVPACLPACLRACLPASLLRSR
jgi:secreted Zn-dependent insulinase-like peptidase